MIGELPELPELDVVIASLLFLMTRHTQNTDPTICRSIIEHLALLERHPDCSSAALKNTSKSLKKQWRGLMSLDTNSLSSDKRGYPINKIDTNVH
ncbi:MAG: hypothetical protein CMQ41_16465 [Gammaproteobacteria bacterium]|nr:hypothetical protein [Gammaproteobacteria bacterium]